MSLNSTPSSDRVHIGFFGMRNAGKSSVVNAVTGQSLSIVSEQKGTTTDPVYKAMELLPLGPVMIIDTPGMDDSGELGEMRVKKARQVLNKTDIAVLVVDAEVGLSHADKELIAVFREKNIPYITVYNKSDLTTVRNIQDKTAVYVSTASGEGIRELKEAIARLTPANNGSRIVGDLIHPSDFIVLVVPIDSAAPKGRLILPQQQTIRDILEANATAIAVKENELKNTLDRLGKKPYMVITDSQVFKTVAAQTPDDVLLTSFSILMARYKGLLDTAVDGVTAIDRLNDGDTVLIAEGCTHHRQCDDIGSVKIPKLLKSYTGKDLNIKLTSGVEFPEDLTPYALVIHCGGCMLNEREVKYRMKCAVDQNVPITNYGTAIAYMNGILKRSVEVFPALYNKINK